MKRALVLITMFFLLSSCSKQVDLTNGEIEKIKYQEVQYKTEFIKIQMEDNQLILAELYPEVAPITVANFQKLVSEKFYDGTTFHRIINNFMIQTGRGQNGQEAQTIKGEFLNNGVDNYLLHERGVLSMARGDDFNSASSEFFIVHQKSPHLDRNYASFGKVIAGMQVVDDLASLPTANKGVLDNPINPPIVRSIRFIEIKEIDND